MTFQEIVAKYRDGVAFFPTAYGIPGCCSGMVLSGFGRTLPDPKRYMEFLKEVEEFYKPSTAMLMAILLQSQMAYGKVMIELGWEESAQISRSNYDKANLMRVFIKSLRPVKEEEILHSEKKQELVNKRAIKAQERQKEIDAYVKATGRYPDRGYEAEVMPEGPFDGCDCTICNNFRNKKEKAA